MDTFTFHKSFFLSYFLKNIYISFLLFWAEGIVFYIPK